MMKEVIATGRTVDAAIDSGCAELGLERGDVDFEIISMPKKGFLGLSQIPAKVRVFVEVPDPKPAPEQKPAPREEKPLPREEKPAPRPAAAGPGARSGRGAEDGGKTAAGRPCPAGAGSSRRARRPL